MTPFPAPNRLHVWWARRPLVASRAAVLASLLPADADHDKFLHAIGIHGDPVLTRRRIEAAKRTGENLGLNVYGYSRAFQYTPDAKEKAILSDAVGGEIANMLVLDPTAGGGSIPFEAERLGVRAIANDLNPVAALILHATIDYPAKHGIALVSEFEDLCKRFLTEVQPHYQGVFPPEPENTIVLGYLFARTVRCPYCDGLIPLSPNWRLSSGGTGVRLMPETAHGPLTTGRVCRFETVYKLEEHSEGTVNDGDARCPYPDCTRVVDGDEIKRQAQAGGMGEQLYTVVFKQRIEVRTKTGKIKEKWERGFRAPRDDDDNSATIAERLAIKLPEWGANDIVPSEDIDELSNYDRGHRLYGVYSWTSMFSRRQLLCHCISVEVYRELLESDRTSGALTDLRKAAYVYLSLALDKLLNYNSRMTRWIVTPGSDGGDI